MKTLLFTLIRDAGVVADGVRWPDGQVALHWRGKYASTAVYASMEMLRGVHGRDLRESMEAPDYIAEEECAEEYLAGYMDLVIR